MATDEATPDTRIYGIFTSVLVADGYDKPEPVYLIREDDEKWLFELPDTWPYKGWRGEKRWFTKEEGTSFKPVPSPFEEIEKKVLEELGEQEFDRHTHNLHSSEPFFPPSAHARIAKLEHQLDSIRKLYEKRCEETVEEFSDGEEMFLADLSMILNDEADYLG